MRRNGFRRSLRVVSEWVTRRRRAEKTGPKQPRLRPIGPDCREANWGMAGALGLFLLVPTTVLYIVYSRLSRTLLVQT